MEIDRIIEDVSAEIATRIAIRARPTPDQNAVAVDNDDPCAAGINPEEPSSGVFHIGTPVGWVGAPTMVSEANETDHHTRPSLSSINRVKNTEGRHVFNSNSTGHRKRLRALPVVLGASALVVLGGAAAFDYSDSAVGARDTASSPTAPNESATPPTTLVVQVASPTVTARPCPKRATFPCLG